MRCLHRSKMSVIGDEFKSMVEKPTILVTGCSTGIGAHCAKRLRETGWHVVVTARKPADLEALRADGFDALYMDYRERESIEACFLAALEVSGGRLDALFNNGAYAQPGAVEDLPEAAMREQFDANFFGWHTLTCLAVRHMRAQGHGRIIFNSSVLGIVPMPLRGAYSATKFAIEGLALTLRMELAGSGIHVSLIEPGPIPSNIAFNAAAYAEKYVDMEGSAHRAAYEKRFAELRAGGTPDAKGTGAEPVFVALQKALNAKSPAPQYHVTMKTRIAAMMRRFVPGRILYELLRRAA